MTKAQGLAIDIGGTKMAIAVFDESGRILAFKRVPMDTLDRNNLVKDITLFLQRWCVEHQWKAVASISVAAPGHPGDSGEFSPNNPNWSFQHMLKALSESWPTANVAGINDVKAACYAEYKSGSWHAESLLHFNLGTGFSAGAVIHGHILQGAHNMAMELGYLLPSLYSLNGQNAKGARSGIAPVEDRISGAGMRAQLYSSGFNDAQAAEILTAGEDDELWPLRVAFVDEFSRVVCNTAITLDPEVITLGGGLAPFCKVLLPTLQSHIDEFLPCPMTIHISQVANHGALLGAIALGWEAMRGVEERLPDTLIQSVLNFKA